jgi:cytidyltransferase-like protein
MAGRPRRVCLGGTFSVLHRGHEALLRRAFESGDDVLVGVTSDKLARAKGRPVPPLAERVVAVARLAGKLAGGKRYEVVVIDDAFGPAATGDFDVIVVSEETERGARAINEKRRLAGLPPLEIVVVPMVLAEDGKPISSSRVSAGEVDARGNKKH